MSKPFATTEELAAKYAALGAWTFVRGNCFVVDRIVFDPKFRSRPAQRYQVLDCEEEVIGFERSRNRAQAMAERVARRGQTFRGWDAERRCSVPVGVAKELLAEAS